MIPADDAKGEGIFARTVILERRNKFCRTVSDRLWNFKPNRFVVLYFGLWCNLFRELHLIPKQCIASENPAMEATYSTN
jgi:hypothetical protein